MYNIRIRYFGASLPDLFESYTLSQVEEFLAQVKMSQVEELKVVCTQAV